jgi:hypothetical protein
VKLEHFQDRFARALMASDAEPHALTRQPGFAVYRNTVMKGCIDALQANYPAVARLVGEEWFRAAAAVYVRANLPSSPTLLDYGESFGAFLAGFPPAAELPYLPGVARLDRFWTEAHRASDAPARAPRPHPSARWAWFDAQPIFTIWQRNRAPGPVDESEIEWRGEGALVFRSRDAVEWLPLEAGGCALLDARAAGTPTGPELALAPLIALLTGKGVLQEEYS